MGAQLGKAKLFAANLGNRILPVAAPNGLYASALLDEKSGEVILKVVNAGNADRGVRVSVGEAKGAARAWVLSSELAAENSLEKPLNVAPVERSTGLDLTLAARSLTVLRVPVR